MWKSISKGFVYSYYENKKKGKTIILFHCELFESTSIYKHYGKFSRNPQKLAKCINFFHNLHQ
jgi:hypothetical protein